ncbi:MAG: threonine-phosphate decarboxylase CobD [Hyphomicrobiales bacterium]
MTTIIPSMIHGGDIEEAMQFAIKAGYDAGKAEDWLDLSTGINPHPYPLPSIASSHWHQLPQPSHMNALLDAAARYYGAPSANHLIAAPGSALLIQMLPSLLNAKSVSIVSPTYGDHAAAWARNGQDINQIKTPHEGAADGITVLVNPNNPDGKTYDADTLKTLAARHSNAGGWLIVDEAFEDCEPNLTAAALTRDYNVIILKSVGKFFGLAGLRLGFAIARPDICARLSAYLGTWAVSGPALSLGRAALQDVDWQTKTRETLKAKSSVFNKLLQDNGLRICGRTDLFTLIEEDNADALFMRLLSHKIYVRRFDYNPHWLRIGLVDCDHNLNRLQKAVSSE